MQDKFLEGEVQTLPPCAPPPGLAKQVSSACVCVNDGQDVESENRRESRTDDKSVELTKAEGALERGSR